MPLFFPRFRSTHNGTSAHAPLSPFTASEKLTAFLFPSDHYRPFDSRTGTDHVTFVTRGRTKPGHGEIAPDGR